MVQTDEGDLNDDNQNSFLQFAGDNVDHSLATLDGKGTFHGMGIILMRTPLDVQESGKCGQDKPIRRLQRNTVSQVVAGHSIPVVQYTAAEVCALSTLTFTDYSLLSHFTAVSGSNRVMNQLPDELPDVSEVDGSASSTFTLKCRPMKQPTVACWFHVFRYPTA